MKPWPPGYGRIVLDEVGSTLDEAARLAGTEPTPFWLLARHQRTARGRRGRPWAMPEGNFAATLVLQLNEPPAQSALRSFVMSLALYRTFEELAGQGASFSLKWPNDVLLNGGKVAGILLESGAVAGTLAIGVGINLVAAPDPSELEPGAMQPVSILEEAGVRLEPDTVLHVLAGHYAELETRFQQFGFAPLRREWLAYAARLGAPITARTAREEVSGTFEDVDPDGQLVIRGARGVVKIAAADVYF